MGNTHSEAATATPRRAPTADRWRAIKTAPPRHKLRETARVPPARDTTGFFRSVTA